MASNNGFQLSGGTLIRNLIAVSITVFVILGTFALAIVAICTDQVSGGLSFIAQTFLPLWGTWIGTVLAFYFSKDNFESASRSYQQIIGRLNPDEKLSRLVVKEVMIPFNRIEFLRYPDDIKRKILTEVLPDPRFRSYNRYAFFTSGNVVQTMIHRSLFDRFISSAVASRVPQAIIEEYTVQNLLEAPSVEIQSNLANGYTFISENATLLDVKMVMEAQKECQDVFVTKNGKANEPVIGLITNNLLLENLKG